MYPEALLLGLVLAYFYHARVKNKNLWRLGMLVCALLLLGRPTIIHRGRGVDLFLVVDRSRSLSDEARAKEREIIDLVSENSSRGDRIGIISFNEKSYLEQAPTSEGAIKSFEIPYSEDASDMSEGLQTALGLAGKNRPAKIFLLSDGEYTGRNPIREAQVARQKKIPVYYRNLKRAVYFNLAITDVETPGKILAGEPFRVGFKTSSMEDTPGRFRLYRNGRIVGKDENDGWRSHEFNAGTNVLSFNDVLQNTGIHSYRIEVEAIPREKEIILKDNVSERFVKVIGEKPMLLVNNTGTPDNLSQVLSAGGLKTHIVAIGNFRLGLNQMEGYKGIILNNVPLINLNRKQIRALRDFSTEEGGGLLVCGGNRSFAAGGYYKTELEPVLPVSLEDRVQSKKISTAFSIVMDRSGSMQMRTPSGETKMMLANNAAVECMKLLTPADSLSVVAVDSSAHIILPQQEVTNPAGISSTILQIEAMGGGIFVYNGLVAGGSELIKATQLNKHLLLFADAADSEQPGEYKELLSDYTDAGITLSVVGLGTENDRDAEFLKDVARRGNGEIYFTEDANQLIQLFTADAISYVRKSFIEEPVPMTIQAAAYTISPDQEWKDFSCSGYNLLFPRSKADVAIRTADEDDAPILAFWQRGLGRVAALALDTDGHFTSTENYGDIVLSTARWIMGSGVFDTLQVKTRYEGDWAEVQMEISTEERGKMGKADMVIFTPSGETITKPLVWDSYNRLSAGFKLSETGCYRGVVKVGEEAYKIGPMSLPTSPEFTRDREPDFGKQTLEQIALISGGREVMDVSELFERTRSRGITSPVTTPFLIAFLILLLLDIAEERFGLLVLARNLASRGKNRMARIRIGELFKPGKIRRKPKTEPGREIEEKKEAPAPKEEREEIKEDMGYLERSKEEVRKRFRKK